MRLCFYFIGGVLYIFFSIDGTLQFMVVVKINGNSFNLLIDSKIGS